MLTQFLKESWTFFVRHLTPLAMIILPIVVPVDLLTTWYFQAVAGAPDSVAEQFSLMAIDFAVYPIYAAGTVFYIASVISGNPIDTRTAWRLGVRYWYPYFVLSILVGMAVFLGLMALVLPGVILLIRFSFSEFDLLLNGEQPLETMKHSWARTGEHFWVLLGGFAAITAVFYGPYYFLAPLLEEGTMLYSLVDIATSLLFAVLGAHYTIFAFRVYDFARGKSRSTTGSPGPE